MENMCMLNSKVAIEKFKNNKAPANEVGVDMIKEAVGRV
jgi:hypothetical protein